MSPTTPAGASMSTTSSTRLAVRASRRRMSPTTSAPSTRTRRSWPRRYVNRPLSSFTEGTVPDQRASVYAQLLEVYPNVLTLRLRMPISDDLSPRNFVTKISKYERVSGPPRDLLYSLEATGKAKRCYVAMVDVGRQRAKLGLYSARSPAHLYRHDQEGAQGRLQLHQPGCCLAQ